MSAGQAVLATMTPDEIKAVMAEFYAATPAVAPKAAAAATITRAAKKQASSPKTPSKPHAVSGSDGTIEVSDAGVITIVITPKGWRKSNSGKSMVATGSGDDGAVVAGCGRGESGYFLITKGLCFRQ
jgi:hypothetical protein